MNTTFKLCFLPDGFREHLDTRDCENSSYECNLLPARASMVTAETAKWEERNADEVGCARKARQRN